MPWTYIISFFQSVVSPKNYKHIFTLLIGLNFFAFVTLYKEVSHTTKKIDAMPDSIKIYVKSELNSMYADGLTIFTRYTFNMREDMKTLVEYSKINRRDAEMLKRYFDKTMNEALNEAKEKELKKRYNNYTDTIYFKTFANYE